MEARGGLETEGDFRAIDPEHTWISAGGGFANADGMAGEEAQFHQASGDIVGHIQAVENAYLAGFQLQKRRGGRAFRGRLLVETHLHSDFSIRLGLGGVKERVEKRRLK